MKIIKTARKPRLIARIGAASLMLGVIAAVVRYQAGYADVLLEDPLFVGYALAVSAYILGRFALSVFYRPKHRISGEPTVTAVVAAFNEERDIGPTIEALMSVDYPQDKLEIIVVDDGSTDRTLAAMKEVGAKDRRVRIISFSHNKGKRHAMAAGFKAGTNEIIVFLDSDSIPDRDGIREIVKPFVDDRVGAVSGHAEAANVRSTWMTRMQAVRYFVAFRVVKGAESLFGAVSCCSGCFSAYRRSAIDPHMEAWLNQRYLGAACTYGDDRSLTTFVLRHHRVLYQSTARVSTTVPENFRQFLKQQMRWKRSWTRESPRLATFAWKKSKVAALFTYLGMALTLLAPVAAIRSLVWRPMVIQEGLPVVYIVGLAAMALVYGLYYATQRGLRSGLWLHGVSYILFYIVFLLWQQYWAILTSRTTSWGTRASTHSTQIARVQMFRPGLPGPSPVVNESGHRTTWSRSPLTNNRLAKRAGTWNRGCKGSAGTA
jgi:hyaluronan synthase